jgi:hypothetical protein
MPGLSLKVATALALSLHLAVPAPALQEPPQQHQARLPCGLHRGDLHLVEGLTIRSVDFHGNEHTSDDLLRRTLRLREGRVFKVRDLRRGLARVHRLGIFQRVRDEDVEWCSSDGPPGWVDLLVVLEHRPTRRRGRR